MNDVGTFLKTEQVTSCALANGVLSTISESTCLHNKIETVIMHPFTIPTLSPMNNLTEISYFNAFRRLNLEEESGFVNYGRVSRRVGKFRNPRTICDA
jgi:hypothetical protein